ncbi:nuclear transport factor 2 family protein [Streptomyces sp. NPDC048002]|uniref:nuclear transport factor 2 family protein n=1 Tax=unclassified Streptomyces TaxID=2593676 RepID=UPI0034093B33
MAEHPHAQLVRKGYEAFERGDMDALRGLMASDCTQHVPGSHPMSGDYKGADAIIDMYARMAEETGGSMRAELRSVMVDGRGHVVAVHRFTADRKGRHIEEDGAIVFRIVGEKATDLDECVADIDAADEFWS